MLALLAPGFLFVAVSARPPPDISGDLEPLSKTLDVPALAIGVADLERIHFIGACGVLGEEEPVRLDGRWDIGSPSPTIPG
ncbi:MAG: hypothetical protein DYG94_09580 [Leptolyngbya sp. PLA3]|nr:MAG: hypothetical protein EDM82_08115 [Cyanobacteria bacterium CYA]MCE7968979.1 hypothetical protein [Leptolyngbya sp. PL-A3]